MRRLPAALALLLAALAACGDRQGARPASLAAPGNVWFQAKEPLDWPSMLGDVVYLEFGFLH